MRAVFEKYGKSSQQNIAILQKLLTNIPYSFAALFFRIITMTS